VIKARKIRINTTNKQTTQKTKKTKQSRKSNKKHTSRKKRAEKNCGLTLRLKSQNGLNRPGQIGLEEIADSF